MKKVLLYTLSFVLVVGAAVAGTVAYLTDTDDDVNVMILGNVKIDQIEQERDESGNLVEFKQAKPLYPAVFKGDSIPWAAEDKWVEKGEQAWKVVEDNENVLDKFVTVKNTGKSDAYVRTLIAFEGDQTYGPEGEYIHIVMNAENVDPKIDVTFVDYITVNGVTYSVYSFTYPSALGAGETSMPSLKQVYMNKGATNDVVATYGDTYDILVLSQAVQTQGFASAQAALDTSFGIANKENAEKWFKNMTIPSVISNANQAYESSTTAGTYTLGADYKTTDAVNHFSKNREYAVKDAKEFTLNLNGHTINHDSVYQDGKNTGYTYLFTTAYNGKLTINGEGTINSANSEGSTCIVYAQGPSEVVINGGNFNTNKGVAIWAGKNAKVTINGGSFVSTGSNHELVYSSGGVIDIYGGFFHNTEWENRPVNVANANRGTGYINIYGGTFVNFNPLTGGDDPNNIKIAEGYEVVSETQANGDVWYSVVKK